MSGINRTSRREFFLLGFNHFQSLTPFLFTLFLIVYILTVVGNVLVVILVSISHRLKTPMYLFLRNLSICEVLFTTNIVPKMLQVLLQGGSTISFTGCMTQLYMFGATGMAECLLLTSMSYDRYLAICKPLHYSSIMNFKQHLYLVIFSWLYGLVLPIIAVSLIYSFDFCDSNTLDHFFCDLAPILELSCSDTSIVEFEVFAQSIPVFIFTFTYIGAAKPSTFGLVNWGVCSHGVRTGRTHQDLPEKDQWEAATEVYHLQDLPGGPMGTAAASEHVTLDLQREISPWSCSEGKKQDLVPKASTRRCPALARTDVSAEQVPLRQEKNGRPQQKRPEIPPVQKRELDP
ncbi:unnamed protein product [Ranitomeya imitator]|uniref:Olfactory receptor n=1 Tax=Ranitomeya imitator TaxID=111125 RepID=A0ABN9M4H8_9NEOB|nr:unnamed protein product [Ranitomeya imitator]